MSPDFATRVGRALADSALPARLDAIARGAASSTPLTLSVDIGPDPGDGLNLLPAPADYWYWARPADREWCLALGSALHYDTAGGERFSALANAWAGLAGAWRHDGRGLAFFGFAFSGEQAADPLPNTRLSIPSLALCARHGRVTLLLTCVAGDVAAAPARWLAQCGEPRADGAMPSLHRQPADLAEQAWQASVAAALRAIDRGEMDKVVLTRTVRLLGTEPIAVRPLLAALAAGHPSCTLYAAGGTDHAFIGATPERLVRLKAGHAEADALAGTAWPGGTPCLASDKNRREQAFVAHAVAEALSSLCDDLVTDPPEALDVGELTHLRTVVRGRPRPDLGLFHLIDALHPTPAVGGCPRRPALEWLHARREKRPAWYTGGIGWIDTAGAGEVAVALRCATITGCEALLSAGAGIVAGSDPTEELAETEAKLAVLGDLLQARPDHRRKGAA